MEILHISYDYPDSFNKNKTKAIKNLVDISEQYYKNHVISLNRVSNYFKEEINCYNNITAIKTFGLPKGILFRYSLKRSIKNVISSNLVLQNIDLIHAHKLTFEGPIAYYLHKNYKIPYLISIRQTDFKVIKFKPFLKNEYIKILLNAKKIIIISPWMKGRLKKIVSKDVYEKIFDKFVVLPNIVENDEEFLTVNNNKFVSIFNMKKSNVKIKNIQRVLKAIYRLKKEDIIINLDIIGDGSGKYRLEKMIKELKLEGQVNLLGEINNQEIINFIKNYKGFILCSYPETFGLVYIEALNAGIPIIYSKYTGIDGYFGKHDIGISVNHSDISEIKNAIKTLNENYKYFKDNVYRVQKKYVLRKFNQESIKDIYINECIWEG